MINTKKAFSFIELLIVLSIIVILAVIWMNMFDDNKRKASNAKIETGVETIKNSLFVYMEENKKLPNPGWNNNYFEVDSSYSYSWSSQSFWVYGSFTQDSLSKKYLDTLPLDPISNHYFSYGKTLDNTYFEIASVLRLEEESQTKLDWNYPWEYGPISLIREYNWPFFVSDWSKEHLPYNPDEHIITAKIGDIQWIVSINGIEVSWTKHLKTWDQIISSSSWSANIYFSDWSVSYLEENSNLVLSEMSYKNSEDNLLTKISLYLGKWSLFTKATSLNSWSDFEIYTADTTAAVRWTIFNVSVNDNNEGTLIEVLEWSVEVYEAPEIELEDDVENNSKPKKLEIKNSRGNIKAWKKVTLEKESNDNSGEINVDDIDESKEEEFKEKLNKDKEKNSRNLAIGKSEDEINEGNCKLNFEGLGCVDDENSLIDSWWELYWYAPYNEAWDLSMYSEDWKFKIDNQLTTNSLYLSNKCNNLSSETTNVFCDVKDSNIKWVYIGWNDSFIKYENLNLNWDFLIEMNVRWDSLKGLEVKYFLDSNVFKFFRKTISSESHLLFNSSGKILKSISNTTDITNDQFYKLKITRENTESELTLEYEGWNVLLVWYTDDDNNKNKIGTGSISDLYIWNRKVWSSNKNWKYPINSIIDYVKIYKKLDSE